MAKNTLPKYLFILLLLIAIGVVFLIVRPFITAILTSMLIAYVTYPLYIQINRLIKNRNLASLIMSFLVVILITLPLFFVIDVVTKEAYISYIISKQKIISGDIFRGGCEGKTNFICSLLAPIKGFLSNPQVRYYLEDAINKLSSYIINLTSSIILSLPLIITNFFVMIFVLFYIYRDGRSLFEKIENLIPLKKDYKKHVLERVNNVTYAVIYGQLMVAVIQGALGGFGFLIFGIHSPFLWGVVMALFALIPYLGPPIIWLPAALSQIVNGYLQADNSLVVKGVLLSLYGMLVVGTIDNILKPKLIGEKGGIHPILALIGVVGGLRLFGFVGVFVGPVILAVFMAIVRIYEEERDLLTIAKHED